MIKSILVVFLGGGLGSILRYLIALWTPASTFPWATFITNVLSSLLLGILIGWMEMSGNLNDKWRLMWLVGFCGGFSTFSTFSYESMLLLHNHQFGAFLLNILLSVVVCVFCIYLGIKLISII